jgi:hypothetical protein
MDEVEKRNSYASRDKSGATSLGRQFDQRLNIPSSERQSSKSPMQSFEFPSVYDIERDKVYLPANLYTSISMAECKELAQIYFVYFYHAIASAP